MTKTFYFNIFSWPSNKMGKLHNYYSPQKEVDSGLFSLSCPFSIRPPLDPGVLTPVFSLVLEP